MEFTTFRLIVFAIVGLLLLAFFFLYIAPLFLWKEEPLEAVKTQLARAETQLGKYTSQGASFSEGYAVQAEAFESASSSIVFNCNSELFCCPEGRDCKKAIEWDNAGRRRYFSFNETKGVKVSARCRYEDIYICRVFIGGEPAQVKILSLELETGELDLSQAEGFKAFFEAENIGKEDMVAVEAIARVYKTGLTKETRGERVFKQEFSTEFPLAKGEKHSGEIEIEIGENGEYEVEIILREKTDETNYEMELFEVIAFGEAKTEGCVAGEMRVQELEKCVYLLPCKCSGITECKNTWRSILKIPEEEELDIMSVDDEKEEIVLKYIAEYEIPEWCDPKTMDCEGYCHYKDVPEPDCEREPCRNDLENCRVCLPCDCEEGASFQKCVDAWRERVGERDFKTGMCKGKKSVYVEGAWIMAVQQMCYACMGPVRTETRNCLLPRVDNCGGNELPKIVKPPEKKPEPKPEPPKDCVPKAMNCINLESVCMQIFLCECASPESCSDIWRGKIQQEMDRAPILISHTYNSKIVPALEGRVKEECDQPWCSPLNTTENCIYQYPPERCTTQ